MTEKKKPNFFGTLPGILTAFAAILTAVGTLLISLDKIGWFEEADIVHVETLTKTDQKPPIKTGLKKPNNNEKNSSTRLTGQWAFIFTYKHKLQADGKKSRTFSARTSETTVQLSEKNNKITGHYLWTTSGCTKAEIEGTIKGKSINFTTTFTGPCCNGTKIEFAGKLISENSIIGKGTPKGLPLENCRTYWTDVTATRG
ncbi:MAG: hypothetical protein V3U84_04640 [Thiotrichaceae bacterium]